MTFDGRPTSLHPQLSTRGDTELRLTGSELTVRCPDHTRSFLDHRRAARQRVGLTDGTPLRIRPDGHVRGAGGELRG
jgi:hypothetical protein